MNITYDELCTVLREKLEGCGVSPERAARTAAIFADNTRDGVYSHGTNRFPRVVAAIRAGLVKPENDPVLLDSMGALERWDGRLGLGVLNAQAAMARAVALAKQYGVGAVAMRATNHWMRAGTYVAEAADAGCVGVCFTNTIANMPVWGSMDCRLGNNPLAIGVPRANGQHVVMDMAMTQFAYGKLETYRLRGEQLPVPGGLDENGAPTCDPAAIEKTQLGLPIGYWKGSGLSLMLDLVLATLSGGAAVKDLGTQPDAEHGVSQIFLALQPPAEGTDAIVEGVLAYTKTAAPLPDAAGTVHPVRTPGEGAAQTRAKNLAQGIPVDDTVWARILAL